MKAPCPFEQGTPPAPACLGGLGEGATFGQEAEGVVRNH